MQLAWLMRPNGENIDQLIRDLDEQSHRGLSLLETIRRFAPPAGANGAYVRGGDLLRVFEGCGIAGLPNTTTLSQAIEMAEAMARRRARAGRSK